jgi:hypothetical protein
MSANARARLGGGEGYRRPSDAALDELTTAVTSDTAGASDTAGTQGSTVTSETRGTSGSRNAELRDHVKVARSKANQMRDAVWFLSEHGRPRVQLGELLDEAVDQWLERAKDQHNSGADFPRRGRLR